MTNSTLLTDLIDLNEALQSDSLLDLDERKQRDRRFGLSLQQVRHKPHQQIRRWLRSTNTDHTKGSGRSGSRIYRIVGLVLLVFGLISGWGLASIVLHYDGSQPINIVYALVALVLPQILLLLLWLLGLLPFKLRLFKNIGAMLGLLNPGRLAGQLTSFFNVQGGQGLSAIWNADNAAVLAPVSRWLFSFWSQLFAFSFNIGILIKAFMLVSFSDLAFAWSTTLQFSNAGFHQFLLMLSTPWSAVIPDAVPTAELVANSRYYRLESGSLSANQTSQLAIALGQWWPFLIAAVCCYGLLPRLLTLSISWFRLRQSMQRALCQMPGASELLARMNSPLVSTVAAEPEKTDSSHVHHVAEQTVSKPYALSCPLIVWSQACTDKVQMQAWCQQLGIDVQDYLQAGGRNSIAEDSELLSSLCRTSPDVVVVLVKAWEPPLLEFTDFVQQIRQHCGAKIPIIILLSSAMEKVSDSDRDTWHQALNPLADPNLHIETTGPVA